MAGRAGRPKFDTKGEAIAIAKTKEAKQEIYNRYIKGEPEEIYSKLAVEPVLRTAVLSLIASGITTTRKDLIEFFSKTFWAFQYRDEKKLAKLVDKMLYLLSEWEFIESQKDGFVSASELKNIGKLKATLIGKRVSELYLDPFTAYHLMTCMKRSKGKVKSIELLQTISHTLEMRPLLRVKSAEYEDMTSATLQNNFLDPEPTMYDPEFDEYLASVKTSLFLEEWINEADEEFLLEKYNIRPGEIRNKLSIADWLCYASEELARMQQQKELLKEWMKLRMRLKYGAKEELLALLKLQNIGRIRARKLFNNKVKTIDDVKNIDITTLNQILGPAIAKDVKKQVGLEVKEEKLEEKKQKQLGQQKLFQK